MLDKSNDKVIEREETANFLEGEIKESGKRQNAANGDQEPNIAITYKIFLITVVFCSTHVPWF